MNKKQLIVAWVISCLFLSLSLDRTFSFSDNQKKAIDEIMKEEGVSTHAYTAEEVDLDKDGQKEAIIIYIIGAHSSGVKVIRFNEDKPVILFEHGSGTPNTQFKIMKNVPTLIFEESDYEPNHVAGKRYEEIYRWNGDNFVLSNKHLDEVNAKFTYKGKPIHPFLVGEFSNWLSDNRPPMITTVDVAAAYDTNKYQKSSIEKRNDWWFAEKQEKDTGVSLYESFGYHWLGKLANGAHVLETGSSGGGSGFFMDLMFVKFSEGEIFWEGKKEAQLLMSVVGTYSLGDRYEGKIKVCPDKVLIPTSESQRGGGSIDKDIELRFPKN